ncbi:MAG: DUF5606 domain-containing protein [Candidatus Amulumruptor caecigallinarius]|nr:DUF5606 domain-containing protein [Candidatus Amulumruptor caecigallinarius]
MLKEIIAISGKPGLFKIISNTKQSLIVEDVTTGKRFPASARDRVMSLGDIMMYTESGDTPLGVILDKVYANANGAKLDVKALASNKGELKQKFGEIVEDFDRERVHDSDIKKLFSWYNLLVEAGMKEFADKPQADVEKEGESDGEKTSEGESEA